MNSTYHRPASYASSQPLSQNRQAFNTLPRRASPGMNSAAPMGGMGGVRREMQPGISSMAGGGWAQPTPPNLLQMLGNSQAGTSFRGTLAQQASLPQYWQRQQSRYGLTGRGLPDVGYLDSLRRAKPYTQPPSYLYS